MNLLGEYIKNYRKEHELSLRQFAKMCDISHTHIDSIERGVDPRTGKTVKISNETILKIANAIDVKPDYLFNLSIGVAVSTETNNNKDEFITMAAHRADDSNSSPVKDIEGLKDLIRQIISEEKDK